MPAAPVLSEAAAAIREAARLHIPATKGDYETVCKACLNALAADLGERYSRERTLLSRFDIYHPAQKESVEKVSRFITSAASNLAGGRGLVLYGAVGTGKDHLLAAAMYHLASAGVPVRWVNGQEIFGRFRDSMDSGVREDSLLKEWATPTVLGISDPIPPGGKPSDYNLMQLYRLLDRRYRMMRPTWISLNALSVEDADEKLSAPVFDRVRDGAEIVRCFWPSYRERAK